MMKAKYFLCTCLVLLMCAFSVHAQQKSYIESLKENPQWVDSVFKKLSKKQRIAQMFFIRVLSNKGQSFEDSIAKVVRKQHIGGLIFFQGGPSRQVALTNRYQSISKVPLLIASDGEWGLGMRLDSTISYPYQMALGAIQDNQLIYKMGLAVARDYKRMGMQLNLAPDVDVNNNANNPVINYRSFGENKYNVTQKSAAYVKGMQDGGLLVSIKHFPGHGDTDVDSHFDLPKLPFTKMRLDSLEMYPFKELIKEDVSGVMVAHMNIPKLDSTVNLPSTLSKPVVTDILKKELNFKGLIISDAMNMKGVVKYFPEGRADVMAVMAGNDVIELSEDSKRAIKLIRKAVRRHEISMERIDESVKKILIAKYWAGLNQKQTINQNGVYEALNQRDNLALQQTLANASVTVLRGTEYIKNLKPEAKTVVISLGVADTTVFQKELALYYSRARLVSLDHHATSADFSALAGQIDTDTQVIIGIHDSRNRPANKLTLSTEILQFIAERSKSDAVFVLFANPYNIPILKGLENGKALVVAYQKEAFMQKAAASVIKHQLKALGKLPVSVVPFFKYGQGE